MTQKRILLTGATGNVGTQVVKKLAAMNIPFKALVRRSDNCGYLKNIPQAELIFGDLGDAPSLAHALQDIEKAFLLTNSSEQAEQLQLNFVEAAHKAGVKHIVKLSQFAADENSPVRFLRYHAKVESKIKELSMAYTFLRPNLYMQGFIAFKEYIKSTGRFHAAAGKAGISVVDIRDIAGIAALALVEAGHENKVYNITGPQSITHYQIADTFSQILGRQVSFVDVSPEQMTDALRAAGFPEWQVGGLIEDYAHYARGEAATASSTVNEITGKEAIGFEQFVKEHKTIFS